ncbi:carcinoembryonic antigen-related cell adhesion molecule 1 isoform X2 [Rana temporaria]|uniref:carcinoembryonic antigen-related cell adhesion molecule 1 isoform X2 n=1 Tax=Rana temporaria TaxID=8407 RepID=UPI001AAC9AED|nr:carcinoembryonic antigen-related cell adhesion molecule 1 isoform X2 [Rana temporaria]
MELIPGFCICVLLSLTLAPASPTELTSNVTGWVWEGGAVSLYCSTQLTNASFIWHVDGDLLPGGDQYHIFVDPLGPNSTLTISPVFRNNTGSYTCFAYNSTLNETSNALNLSVAKPPSNPSIYCRSDGYTEQVLLGCFWAGGQPSADVKLSFNGTVKEGKDEVTWTVSLDYEVRQPELVCQGDQLGKTSECKIVFERPLSSSHNNNAVTSVTEGENPKLIVTLNTPNSLNPTFSWFHLNPDPVAITSGGKFKVESGDSQSSLLISNVAQSENGTYECRARNIIGSTTFKLNLEVKSQESSGSSRLSRGAIAGIVIGVVAGVALIVVVGYFLVKKVF